MPDPDQRNRDQQMDLREYICLAVPGWPGVLSRETGIRPPKGELELMAKRRDGLTISRNETWCHARDSRSF